MSKQVFEGLKVADFSWVITGPFITKYLADHGAEVIRIESPGRPCLLRRTAPYKDGISSVDRAPFYAWYNNNKYGISLNLNQPKGREVAGRVVARADIVCENFTPGTMKRWGLDYESLKKIKPDIIMISSCNQGQTGPRASQPGMGLHLASLGGFSHLTGWPDGSPVIPFAAYTDAIGPRFGTVAIVAALDYRRRTGKGQHLDLSQYEAGAQFIAPLCLDYVVNQRIAQRSGNRDPNASPHGAYPCRGEDRWCAIAVFTDEQWHSFRKAIGDPAWAREPKFLTLQGRKENEDELDQRVGEWTKHLTAEEVMKKMQSAGVAAGVVSTCQELYSDSQLKHRQAFWTLKHREMGEHSTQSPSFKLSKTPAKPRMGAPCLGEHNEYICTEILGYSDQEFIELLDEGVFE